MTVLELVQAAQISKPGVFSKINEKRATAIVRAALAELNKEIKKTEEGKVTVPVLGTFVAQKLKVQKEGSETIRRRVVFSASKAKGKAK